MLPFADMNGRNDASIAMLDALTVTSDCNGSGGVHAGIKRHEGRPAEKQDEEQPGNRHAQPDLALWIARDGFRPGGQHQEVGAHAAFSAEGFCGPASRLMTA